MNRKIYLVQLWPGFHRAANDSHADDVTAFTAPHLANEWARNNSPIALNPFTIAYPDWHNRTQDAHSLIFKFLSDTNINCPEMEARVISLRTIEELVQSLGLSLPTVEDIRLDEFVQSLHWSPGKIKNEYIDRMWHDWWNTNQFTMTDTQKTTLWRFLVPQPYNVIVLDLE